MADRPRDIESNVMNKMSEKPYHVKSTIYPNSNTELEDGSLWPVAAVWIDHRCRYRYQMYMVMVM